MVYKYNYQTYTTLVTIPWAPVEIFVGVGGYLDPQKTHHGEKSSKKDSTW